MTARILFSFLFFVQTANGQQSRPAKIPFLSAPPVIDGVLDSRLTGLEKRKFNHFFRFDNPVTAPVNITYRMGYNQTHLYLYIETEADSITYRDRGFINGDGFKLLVAKPQNDSLTDEYYDIVFSPSRDKNYPSRKRIWEYNRKQDHGKKLSSETQFEEKCMNGKCGFEIALAWKDIDPFYPWFSEKIGYNLYFAKAIADNMANGYAVVEDEGIWDEEIPKRNFAPVVFEKPGESANRIMVVQPGRRNLKTGSNLDLNIVSMGYKAATGPISVTILDDSSKTVFSRTITCKVTQSLKKDLVTLRTTHLLPGNYNLVIRSQKDKTEQFNFVVFPVIDFDSIRSHIRDNVNRMDAGIVNTLLFKVGRFEQNLSLLKKYEPGNTLLKQWNLVESEYNLFLKGKDPYKNITVPYRRAFRSKYDNTLQPYTIKLPKNYDPGKKYPLLVFLHGSGQDEQMVLNSPRSDGNFIELAPYGRDMYRCYSSDSSQNDIMEAIEDVQLCFRVDKEKIIIGGFSMGGYGALRTFYEHPDLYKGIAVFAGHPQLAGDWLGEGHPDFLEDKYLEKFKNKPVFLYHGRKDGALPVAKAEEFIRKAGSKEIQVTARLIENKTHEYPDDETMRIYFAWLEKIINE